MLTLRRFQVYASTVAAKSATGILTPELKGSNKLSLAGLFLCLSIMAGRLQAPSGGRFSLSGGQNLFSACHPILTRVVCLCLIKEAFTMPNPTQVTPSKNLDSYFEHSSFIAEFGLSCLTDLGALFRAILESSDNHSSANELAKIGKDLSNDWENLIDCYRENLKQLRSEIV